MSTVGIIVNPLAGKDIRRLVSHASPSTDKSKVDSIRRAVVAAADAGAERILLAPDSRGLTAAGVAGLELPATVETLDMIIRGQRQDTSEAAAGLEEAGADAIVSLGGDGTHRDIAVGWSSAPLVPISTGTNNAFPLLVDATLAGCAAGLVATTSVGLDEVATTSKVLKVDSAPEPTLALVDAVLVDGRFTGSRAVWNPDSLRTIVAAVADPAALGLSSVAGRLHRALPDEDHGVVVHCSPDASRSVSAPIVPGAASAVGVVSVALFGPSEAIDIRGPGVLALDGERHVVLDDRDSVSITLERTGPRVIDPWMAVRFAADLGLFERRP